MTTRKIGKIIIFLLFIFSFFIFIFSVSFADQKTALSDYNVNFEKYRNDYQEFSKSKNTYLTYKTLNSESDALNQTKILLVDRADVLISYLKLLNEVVSANEGISDFDKSVLQNSISIRSFYFQNHLDGISAITSLNDIVQKSKEIDSKKNEIQGEADKIVGKILIGYVKKYGNLASVCINELSQTIIEIKNKGNDTTKLERWLLETNNKYQLANSKIEEADNLLNNLSQYETYKEQQDYKNARKLILEANQYLKEAIFNLKEGIIEIKNGLYN